MKLKYILPLVVLLFSSCASNSVDSRMSYNKAEKSEFIARNEAVSDIITVAFFAESTLEELGSFEVTLIVKPEILQLSEFMPVSYTGYKLTYSYNDKSGHLKIIGYRTDNSGQKGRFKIANLYFKNLQTKKYAALQRNSIELYADNSYSPLPEQKKIDASFSLALYEGYITNK